MDKVARKVVKAENEPELVFSVEIPGWLRDSAIDTRSTAQFQADMRQTIEARLGCLFSLKDGVMTTADGRLLKLVVTPEACEAYAL